MMSMQQSTEPTRKREPDIDMPGKDYVLENGFSGRVRCGRLFVNEGIKADGLIDADTVFIYGSFKGVITANLVTVFDSGDFVGHSRSINLKVAGRACGLLHTERLTARGDAMIEGEVIADFIVRQDTTRILARLSVGPGFFDAKEYLEAAKKRMDVTPAASRKPERPPVALVVTEPQPPVLEFVAPRQVDPPPVHVPAFVSSAAIDRPKAKPFLLLPTNGISP